MNVKLDRCEVEVRQKRKIAGLDQMVKVDKTISQK